MNDDFKNPYNFVKIDWNRKPVKEYPLTYEKFQGKSGSIKLKITSLSPLFTRHTYKENERRKPDGINFPIQFAHNSKGEYLIPGSSLKGMLRATAEAIANSCLSIFANTYEGNHGITYMLKSNDFYACKEKELCITCRLFGMQSKKTSFKGKVSVSDAKCKTPPKIYRDIILPILSTPKPHHTAFYKDPDEDRNVIAGRKFYYHSKNITEAPRIKFSNRTGKPYNVKITPLDKGNVFYSTVDFENLTEEELSLLIYTLVLEDGVCHKIGMGKPAGLGSIKIEIERITFLDFLKRFEQQEEWSEEIEGDALKEYIKNKTKLYRDSKAVNLESLRKIWKYPPEDVDYSYPDRYWFKENPKKKLNGE